MQLAAALSGAPLMNDFCSVSLSDKLTPWELIKKRIEGAILGDFVIAIFNPQSIERNWQLKSIVDLFLKSRASDTPVLIARQVGRVNQSKIFVTLNKSFLTSTDILLFETFTILIGICRSKNLNNSISSRFSIILFP